MEQNTSQAVMSSRYEPVDSLDDFPTPLWATRALLLYVIKDKNLKSKTCLEPACGRGDMSKALKEHFGQVISSDIHDYGYEGAIVRNFLTLDNWTNVDWVITNPPFKLAEEFVLRGLNVANVGVAILARTVFIESVGRYDSLFSTYPPATVAQFVERVPMVKGRLDKTASTATSYMWIVWRAGNAGKTNLIWIPPCRHRLECPADYPI